MLAWSLDEGGTIYGSGFRSRRNQLRAPILTKFDGTYYLSFSTNIYDTDKYYLRDGFHDF